MDQIYIYLWVKFIKVINSKLSPLDNPKQSQDCHQHFKDFYINSERSCPCFIWSHTAGLFNWHLSLETVSNACKSSKKGTSKMLKMDPAALNRCMRDSSCTPLASENTRAKYAWWKYHPFINHSMLALDVTVKMLLLYKNPAVAEISCHVLAFLIGLL